MANITNAQFQNGDLLLRGQFDLNNLKITVGGREFTRVDLHSAAADRILIPADKLPQEREFSFVLEDGQGPPIQRRVRRPDPAPVNNNDKAKKDGGGALPMWLAAGAALFAALFALLAYLGQKDVKEAVYDNESGVSVLDVAVGNGKFLHNNVATKDDLKSLATKDDLKSLASKDDLKSITTKDDLKSLATKDDLAPLAKGDDLDAVKKIAERGLAADRLLIRAEGGYAALIERAKGHQGIEPKVAPPVVRPVGQAPVTKGTPSGTPKITARPLAPTP